MDKVSPRICLMEMRRRDCFLGINPREGRIEGRRNGRKEGGRGSFRLCKRDSNPQLMLLCIRGMPVTRDESSGIAFSALRRNRSEFLPLRMRFQMEVPAGLPGGGSKMHRIEMKAHLNAIVPL